MTIVPETIEEQLLTPGGVAALHCQLTNPKLLSKWASYACRGDTTRLAALLLRRGVRLDTVLDDSLPDICADNSGQGLLPSNIPHQSKHWALKFHAHDVCPSKDPGATSPVDQTNTENSYLGLWLPHADHAWSLLQHRLGSKTLSDDLILDLKLALVRQLIQISKKALRKEFLFGNFRFDQSSWQRLMTAYPILNRLVVTVCEQWSTNTLLVLRRWLRDRENVQEYFFADETAPIELLNIQCDLGDPHNGGLRTSLLRFSNGLKLIYKPRAVDIEMGWRDCLRWLRSHKLEHSIVSPEILAGKDVSSDLHVVSDYGWFEFLETPETAMPIDITELSHNCGVLTALAWMFSLNDLHTANLVMGEHAINPIDVETLLYPLPPKQGEQHATVPTFQELRQELRDSVLYSGLLPRWGHGLEGEVGNISGLGMVESLDRQRFHKGFRNTAYFFLDNLEMSLSECGPLQFFQGLTSRVLYRSTGVYEMLKGNSLEAVNLRNGTVWSLPWEALHRHNDWQSNDSIISAEKLALSQLDVPLFHARSDQRHLYANDQICVANYFELSGLDVVKKRLRSLGKKEIEFQSHLCELSISAVEKPSEVLASRCDFAESPKTRDALLDMCRALADQIEECAHVYGKSAAWCGISPVSDGKHFQVDGLDLGLYNGNLGICLYLAALDKTLAKNCHQPLIEKALFPLQEMLDDRALSGQLIASCGIGVGSGVGGMLYTLAKMMQWQPTASIYEMGNQLVNCCSDYLIDSDRQYDVMTGCAGAILGLLAWYTVSNQQAALDKAVRCGEKLVLAQHKSGTCQGAWPGPLAPALCGMSHGNAGIVLSLLRLQQHSPKPQIQSAIAMALEFESTQFDTNDQNWLDLRSDSSFANGGSQWCHGAAGIGLARVGSLEYLDTPQIRSDINHAVMHVSGQDLKSLDYLCCGNLGAIELLLEAGIKTKQESLIELAEAKAALVYGRAASNGSFAFDLGDDGDNPGFFRGIAGIGYFMLRLKDPKLPCVLLLE